MHTVFYEAVYTCLPQTSNKEHGRDVGNLEVGGKSAAILQYGERQSGTERRMVPQKLIDSTVYLRR